MFSNAKPHVPDLFKAIIDSDNEISALKAQDVIAIDDWKALKADRAELRRDAEIALRRIPDNRSRAS
jgi:hypothetical protein